MRRFLVRLTAIAALVLTIVIVYGTLAEAHAADRHGVGGGVVSYADAAFVPTDQQRLDSLATQLVGAPTTVVCVPTDPNGDNAGWVILPDPVIYLEGTLCGSLANVLRASPRTVKWVRTFDGGQTVGYAFLALVHEATHLIEYHSADPVSAYDEGLTECSAFRNAYPLLKLLSGDWKGRASIYSGVKSYHYGKPTTGINSAYRKVC